MIRTVWRLRTAVASFVAAFVIAAAAAEPALAGSGYTVGPISDISTACPGVSGDIEQAVDPRGDDVYVAWEGCSDQIGFAVSTDGGSTFAPASAIPGSYGAWDPMVAVGPGGTVYVLFMVTRYTRSFPVLAISHDHGETFSHETWLWPPVANNWGDEPYMAIAPDGKIYVTWDEGPSASEVTIVCAKGGSCYFTAGDVNAVIQSSTDGGLTFGPISYISPGYPASGADAAPIVVAPNGTLDVLYQGYSITNPATLTFGPGYAYFTRSSDGGTTWSPPVAVDPSAGTETPDEWWNDGSIGIDTAGNLYAVWDTQTSTTDTGWLSYSTDGGASWSPALQGPTDDEPVPHNMEVIGGPAGTAYVGWVSDDNPAGYAAYLRLFSIASGWLSPPAQISTQYGDPSVAPGDTFGLSALSPTQLVLSWGSAVPPHRWYESVLAAPVTVSF